MTDSHTDSRTPSIPEFESLFINNYALDRVDAYLKRFNPIKTMGMQRMEIRHSAILGWLLDPQESHGLGDQFLKSFLAAAMRDESGEDLSMIALEISQSDLMDAEVRREWRNIDLLVLSRANGWVFVIENKFQSRQHSNQLARYLDIIQGIFKAKQGDKHVDLKPHGIFLSLLDEEPEDPRYARIRYQEMREILRSVVSNQVRPLATEVKTFIEHYLEVIEEESGMDDEKNKAIKLARQLYRDHKKVLDFVVEHGTGNDFTFACDAIFGEQLKVYSPVHIAGETFIYNSASSSYVSFLPKSWFDAFGGDKYWWHGCDNWWAGFPVICWLQLIPQNDKNLAQLRLYAEVGPLVEYELRKALIEAIQETAASKDLQKVSFQKTATNEGKKFSKFLTDNSISIDDMNNSEEIAAKMEILLNRFQPTFDALAQPLSQFIEYGKKEAL
ncbi:MAG: PD-(D/E)XK nuclease family protein [Alphaproteobacteria bacterium]|nr:PD-(D/E)XK nuclease family protein [Alphaproteobacteria bacterium]